LVNCQPDRLGYLSKGQSRDTLIIKSHKEGEPSSKEFQLKLETPKNANVSKMRLRPSQILEEAKKDV